MQAPFSWHNWPPTKTQEQTQLMQTWLHACSATVWLRNLRLDRANGRAWTVVSRQNIDIIIHIYIYIYLYTNSLWVHLRVSIHRHDVCPTYGKPVQKYKICCVICFGGIIPPEKLILGPRCPNPKLKNTFSWQKWLFRRIGRASVYVFMWNVSDTAYKSRKVSLKWCKLCPGPHLLHFFKVPGLRSNTAQIRTNLNCTVLYVWFAIFELLHEIYSTQPWGGAIL